MRCGFWKYSSLELFIYFGIQKRLLPYMFLGKFNISLNLKTLFLFIIRLGRILQRNPTKGFSDTANVWYLIKSWGSILLEGQEHIVLTFPMLMRFGGTKGFRTSKEYLTLRLSIFNCEFYRVEYNPIFHKVWYFINITHIIYCIWKARWIKDMISLFF